MTRLSLIKRIENYAKARPQTWVSGGEYEKLSIQAGYKGSHADRRCRDLVVAGVLEKNIERGHVWYRWRSPEQIVANLEATVKAVEIKKNMGYPDYVEVESHQGALI